MAKKQNSQTIQGSFQPTEIYQVGKLYDVFLSYSRKDANFVLQLRDELIQNKIEVFMDQAELVGGDLWRPALERGIEASSNIVFIISPGSLNSEWCQRELNYAFEKNKRVVPLIYFDINRSDIPDRLRQLQTIYFNRVPFETAFEQLRAVLETDRAWVKEQSRLLVEAWRWQTRPNAKDNSMLLRGKELQEAETWLSQAGSGRRPPREQLQLEAQFIEASRKQEIYRQRRLLIIATMVSILLALLAVLAVIFGISAEERRVEAERQTQLVKEQLKVSYSLQLAAQSRNLVFDHPEQALLLATTARQFNDRFESRSAQVELFNLQPNLYRYLHGHNNWINSIAFSPDGKILASASLVDRKIILWDFLAGKIRTTLASPDHGVLSIAFSPDSKTLVSAGIPGLVVWDIASGKAILSLNEPPGLVNHLAFSPNGKFLACANDNGTVVIWETAGWKPFKTLIGHTNSVTRVVFSPDGKTLATGGMDGKVKLWEVESWRVFNTLSGYTATVPALVFSPNGEQLATAGNFDEGVIIWDAKGSKKQATLDVQASSGLAYSPDGKRLVTGGVEKAVTIWDVSSWQMVTKLSGHSLAVTEVAYSPDGQTLVTAGQDANLILWKDHSTYKVLAGHTDLVRSVNFSPDGKILASAGNDHQVKLWDSTSGKIINTLNGHTLTLFNATFSPDGKVLASAGSDKVIILWDVATGQQLTTLNGHNSAILGVAFSSDSKILATGDSNGNIILWDVVGQKQLKAFSPSPTALNRSYIITTLALSPDNKILAVGTINQLVFLWDLTSNQPPVQLTHNGLILSVAFSPEGKILATSSGDKSITLWEVNSAKILNRFTGHTNFVNTLAFSPDGRWLASGSVDKSIIIWEVANGTRFTTLNGHKEAVNRVGFSPDGKVLASASADKTVILWNLDPESWEKQACAIANRNLTKQEWVQYLGSEPYHKTCADIPENQ